MDELDYFDFSDIQRSISDNGSEFDFGEMVNNLFSGNTDSAFAMMSQKIMDVLCGELIAQREVIGKLLIIGIVAALISNISKSFLSGAVSEMGFYITFIMMLTVLCAGYVVTAKMVYATLEGLIEIMNCIVPVFIMSVAFATGQQSAIAFYQVMMIVIMMIEKILMNFVVPLIYVFMITNFINNVSSNGFLTKFCELIKSLINWLLKSMLGVVIGVNVIRSLINPVVDSIKTTTFGKAVSVIPGIGNVLSSMSGIILGSGTIIKNSIGVASMLAIIVIVFVPVVKTTIISLCYKASGAVLEPISDKRVVNAINGVYESTVLLARVLLYAVAFFVLSLAIVCSSTNMMRW